MGRGNNSGGLGVPCITHSERPAFGSSQVPHPILKLLSVISGTAGPGRVTLFTAGGLLVLDRLTVEAVNSVVFGGVTACCCNCKYTMWENVFCTFSQVIWCYLQKKVGFMTIKTVVLNPTDHYTDYFCSNRNATGSERLFKDYYSFTYLSISHFISVIALLVQFLLLLWISNLLWELRVVWTGMAHCSEPPIVQKMSHWTKLSQKQTLIALKAQRSENTLSPLVFFPPPTFC